MNKNVLHLIDTLSLGGAQTILKSVLEHHKSEYMHVYALRQKAPEINIDCVNKYIFPSEAKYSFKPLKHLANYITEHKIEMLHCHLFRSEVTGWLIKKNYHPNIKLIFHEHGQIVGSDTNRPHEDWLYNTFKKKSHNKADLIIAVSQAMRKLLIEKGKTPPEKVKTIYNFVNLEKFDIQKLEKTKPVFKTEFALSNNFIVGFAGRIIPRKGWKSFVEMAEIIGKKEKNIKFLMAGTGADLDKLRNEIKARKLEKTVFLLGFIDNMLEFYKSIDCFVMPSWFEGLPMAQLEVMALGIPLLTTTGPGMNEVPTDGEDAIFLEMKNPEDMAEKVIGLYKNATLQKKLSKQASKTVQNYGLDNFMQQLENAYKTI